MRDVPPAESLGAARRLYAEVVVPRHIRSSFTYLVPLHLRPILRVGHCVHVPFGRARLQGTVVSLGDHLPAGLSRERLKEISSITTADGPDEISPELLALAKRVADYYVAPLGQCLRLVLSPSTVSTKRGSLLKLTTSGREALATGILDDQPRSLLERLRKKPAGIRMTTLLKPGPFVQTHVIEDVIQKGWVARIQSRADHEEFPEVDSSQTTMSTMPPDDGSTLADDAISRALESRLHAVLEGGRSDTLILQASLAERMELLHGSIHRTLASGRSVLVLIGETDRARWVADRLTRRGIVVACYLHATSPDETRAEVWRRVKGPVPQVVVGTRSAVFLPFSALGMIWVEAPGDSSLKEPQEPRYHARDVARFRIEAGQSFLILGCSRIPLDIADPMDDSGTIVRQSPAMESTPNVEVVDLRSFGKGALVTPPLLDAMREAIDSRSGVLLFLNRKGYANALVCRDCGQVPRCASCRIALAYSRRTGRLLCSYCGTSIAPPGTCPICSGHRLQPVGEGTERVEEEVGRLFPGARVMRADGDSMRKPSQAATGWKAIQDRQWDVLIGTQLVLRDYAVPMVGLVGVVHSDVSLNVPDFRAAERSYHMLCDAMALARPAKDGGRIVIQSHLPSHHAIQAVVHRDERIFAAEELSHRAALGYPPAVHLIGLYVSGRDQGLVEKAALELVDRLRASLNMPDKASLAGLGEDAVLGPVAPPGAHVRGRHRRQILVKSVRREQGVRSVQQNLELLESIYRKHVVKFDVDVDPVEMW
ncbi:putative Primosomal protein N [Nitrospira japonica]|uniref:Probable replication restart protein PriA n=1 Tax=Nitrospira japonica TaxID=1325564 RepID=A0A1W1I3B9_9BACT|nr:primosomal protein N' [Nitrospira japonica]SLM47484.1 putative Primosomal protein N [Nitrospira japonica]